MISLHNDIGWQRKFILLRILMLFRVRVTFFLIVVHNAFLQLRLLTVTHTLQQSTLDLDYIQLFFLKIIHAFLCTGITLSFFRLLDEALL